MHIKNRQIIAEDIRMALIGFGYEATESAINYTQAIKMIEGEKPDLVLLDINLSGYKDGYDIALEIKEDYNIPFIFLTGSTDANSLLRVKMMNPSAVLVKLFNRANLYAAIEIAVYNFHDEKSKL